ncbi:MAG TPA: hypothetical protein VLL31_07420 [Sulfurovum sp.]|nr:hypothetical protein [Sulfurovum sp.]
MKRHISLQTLKTDIAKREALLKTLCSLYPNLIGYSEAQLSAYFGLRTPEELYQHIENIQNPPTPHPESFDQQEYTICSCTDAKGYPKSLYETEASAQKEMELTKIKLSIYPCPSGCGWHLTKR